MASIPSLEDAAALTAPTQRGSLARVYNMITYIFQNFLGVDPSIIMNASVFLATASAFAGFLGGSVLTYIRQYFVTTVRIRPGDQLNEKVMQWYLQKHFSPSAARSLSAITDYAEPDQQDDPFGIARRMRRGGSRGQVSPRKTAVVPVRLLPRNTNHYMIYDRNIVSISFSDRALDASYTGFSRDKKDVLTIECLGRSAKTIEKLIMEAHLFSVAEAKAKTNIYRLSAGEWILNSAKSSRRINTVIVEKSKKDALIEDIKDFLRPTTRDWYSKHGIPYRRGYLFSGPPGTGKSSLTAALAGLFGLDIYTMSLEDPYVNGDGSLMSILSDVSANSMLLFEDIDVALSKRRINKTENQPDLGGRMRGGPAQSGAYITLSGLLNAIDGIASATGRILIMTTNRPQELDSALTRPGRVDMRVDFKLPRRPEIELLFQTFYADLVDNPAPTMDGTAPTTDLATNFNDEKIAGLTTAGLQTLARQFADSVPENSLSFAALQGHLLGYKHDPHAAVEKTAAWLRSYEEEEEQEKEEAKIEEEGNKKQASVPLDFPAMLGVPPMRPGMVQFRG